MNYRGTLGSKQVRRKYLEHITFFQTNGIPEKELGFLHRMERNPKIIPPLELTTEYHREDVAMAHRSQHSVDAAESRRLIIQNKSEITTKHHTPDSPACIQQTKVIKEIQNIRPKVLSRQKGERNPHKWKDNDKILFYGLFIKRPIFTKAIITYANDSAQEH